MGVIRGPQALWWPGGPSSVESWLPAHTQGTPDIARDARPRCRDSGPQRHPRSQEVADAVDLSAPPWSSRSISVPARARLCAQLRATDEPSCARAQHHPPQTPRRGAERHSTVWEPVGGQLRHTAVGGRSMCHGPLLRTPRCVCRAAFRERSLRKPWGRVEHPPPFENPIDAKV